MLLVIVSTQPSRLDGFRSLLGNLAAQRPAAPWMLHVMYDGFDGDPRVDGIDALKTAGVEVATECMPSGPSGTALRLLAALDHPEADVVAVLDDDIRLPSDYLSVGLFGLHNAPDHVACVSFHGKTWRDGCFGRCERASFDERVPATLEVHAPGAGLSFNRAAFVRRTLEECDLAQFRYACDLLLGYAAWRQGMKIHVLPHEAGWLANYRQYPDAIYTTKKREQEAVFHAIAAQGWPSNGRLGGGAWAGDAS